MTTPIHTWRKFLKLHGSHEAQETWARARAGRLPNIHRHTGTPGWGYGMLTLWTLSSSLRPLHRVLLCSSILPPMIGTSCHLPVTVAGPHSWQNWKRQNVLICWLGKEDAEGRYTLVQNLRCYLATQRTFSCSLKKKQASIQQFCCWLVGNVPHAGAQHHHLEPSGFSLSFYSKFTRLSAKRKQTQEAKSNSVKINEDVGHNGIPFIHHIRTSVSLIRDY